MLTISFYRTNFISILSVLILVFINHRERKKRTCLCPVTSQLHHGAAQIDRINLWQPLIVIAYIPNNDNDNNRHLNCAVYIDNSIPRRTRKTERMRELG